MIMEQKIGTIIAIMVLGAVLALVMFNLMPPAPGPAPAIELANAAPPADVATAAPFREYPIGETEQRGMHIAAVWLPPVQMEGMELPQDANVIHLEADIHALEGNVNGFGRGAWIPYLSVRYEIIPVEAGKGAVTGEFMPMVAKDGPHYGATIEMPGPGKFRLVYHIDPPSKNGFGRHSDPVTGVAAWWDAFKVEFDFDYARAASDPRDTAPKGEPASEQPAP
jgi:uncharacterized protein involved in high-affinity Fe2+ transport